MPKQEFIRKLTKKGQYSYFVILPKRLIDSYSWKDRQKVVVKSYGKNKILISDWVPRKKRKR